MPPAARDNPRMKILLANPRGFCAGVDRAIEIVERALDTFGAPIYVRHEVVHNRFVVQRLRDRGAVFVDELSEIPDEGTVIFSAHGVSQQVREEAQQRDLTVFDATCPLVTKVHLEVARHCKAGHEVVLIGHKGHPEVEGTMGQYRCVDEESGIYLVETPEDVDELLIRNPDQVAFVTQTTLSMHDTALVIAALQRRFPSIRGPRKDDICYATQNRQDAVTRLAMNCDLVLVVGSPNSSNSNRLKEIAEKQNRPAYLIDGPEDIRREWLHGVETVGLSAGASAPEVLVENVIRQLQEWGAEVVEEDSGESETVVFGLPKNLLAAMAER
jgi:4-hydroxy-3-methylbut-2-enyl diphosphate reductase